MLQLSTNASGFFFKNSREPILKSNLFKALKLVSIVLAFICLSSLVVVAQWLQTNGPEGGAISDLLLDAGSLYAVTVDGGVYKSVDGGASWSLVGADIIDNGGNSIIKSGSNIIAGSSGGPYLSGNSGASWSYSISGLISSDVSQLLLSGSDIYAATPGGVYISGNDGVNWSGVGLTDLSSDIEAIAMNGATLWAGSSALYKSVNSGINWVEITNVGFADTGINFVYVSGSNMLAQSSAGEGIKYTSNGGASWAAVTGISETITTISENGGILYAGTNGGGIYTSVDDGATWSSFSTIGLTNDIITRILFDGTTWYAGSGGGVYKSTDSGANWTEMVSGMKAHKVNALLADGAELYAGTAGGGIYKSSDGGNLWSKSNSGVTGKNFIVFSLLKSGTDLYAGTFGGVVKTSNNGTSWQQKNTGLSFTFGGKSMVSAGSNLFVLDFLSTIYTSNDGGDNWSTAMGNGGNTFSGLPWSMGSDGVNIYASGFFGDIVMKSSDAGTNWLSSATGITNSGFNFALQFFYDGTSMYAATAEGMFRSDDSGASWVGAGTGLPGDNVNAFTKEGSEVYVGTGGGGVYKTSNQGANWTAFNTGLGNLNVTSFSESLSYVGTNGSGVWNVSLTAPELVGLNPDRNTLSLPENGNISIQFNTGIDQTTIANNISVRGSQSGVIDFTLAPSSNEIILLNPTSDLFAGEEVFVTILDDLKSLDGGLILNDISYSFFVKSTAKIPNFVLKSSTLSSYTRSVAAGDINGDGLVDYCASNETEGVYWYKNNGDGTFQEINLTPTAYLLSNIHIADIDNDGDNDIIVTSEGIHIFENDGSESFSVTNIVGSQGAWFQNSKLVDIDADGDIDIVGSNSTELYWFEQTLALQFGAFHTLGNYSTIQDLDVADIDKDGDLDIYTVFKNGANTVNKIIAFKNDGNQNFSTSDILVNNSSSVSLNLADIDNDGDLDIIVGGNDLLLFENTGSGFVRSVIEANIYFGSPTIEIIDLDGDGDLDILTGFSAYQENGQKIYYNDNGTFTTQTILGLDYAFSIAVADFNDDNVMDFVVGLVGVESARLYLNAYSPITPQVPVVSNITETSIDIAWQQPEDFGYPISEYVLEQKVQGGSFQVIYSGGNNLSYSSTGLVKSSNYSYKVKAINSKGESSYSPVITATTLLLSAETDITAFSLAEETGAAIIDAVNHTINIEVAYGTDLTALVATFTLSLNASAETSIGNQISGSTQNDFTNAVVYSVTAENGVTSQNWVVTVTVAPNAATDIVTFSFIEQTSSAVIDDNAKTVQVEVAYGTNLTSLISTYTLSAGATAKVGTTSQVSGVTVNDFSSPVTYTILAEDGVTSQDWEVTVTVVPNTEAEITAFSFPEQAQPAYIDVTNRSVTVQVGYGTDVATLVASFTLSDGATATVESVDQISGTTPNNFTSNVTYTITADDGVSTNNWTVMVNVIANSEANITAFSLAEQAGIATIDAINKTVDIQVVYGTSLTNLIASFELSTGAVASIDGTNQTSGITTNDFTNPLTYTITAEDGITIQNWTITVMVAKNSATDITVFSFAQQTGDAVIDTSNKSIAIEVATGTDVTTLVAGFTLSDGANASIGAVAQVSESTANNFTDDVTYTITAEDGITAQDWVVSVTVALNTATEITAFSFPEQTEDAVINTSNNTVEIQVAIDTDVTSLVASFTLSSGAVAEVNGTLQVSGATSNDFSNSVTYTITAEDGVTTQDWTVTIKLVTGLNDVMFGAQVGQVYPNPFNDVVSVPINIKESNATINIKLIDLNGKILIEDVIRNQSAGDFEYVFRASKFKSEMKNGTYVLRIEIKTRVNTEVFTKKIIYQLD